MLPEISSVRVSQQGKDQLIKLKRVTGIKQWNVLCRWALAVSLADPSPPLVRDIAGDSNVEMTWRTFAGSEATAYSALLRQRAKIDGEADLAVVLRAHLHRGLGHLSGGLHRDQSIEDLVSTCLS